MAFKATLRNPKLSLSAKAVLFIIKSYGNSDGTYCYPSEETLASDAGCSIRTIQRAISELRSARLLYGEQRSNKDGTKSTVGFLIDDERHAKLAIPKRKKATQPCDTRGGRFATPVADGKASKIVHFTEENRAAG